MTNLSNLVLLKKKIMNPISVDELESAFNPSLIVHTLDSTPPPKNKYFYLWINSCWNSFITTVLHDLIQRKLVVIYADDLLILAKGRKLHRLVLIEVFRILKKYNVKLSINKCNCFVDKFQFLGFNFDSNGITLTDERISGILNLEPPCNLKGLQRILGSMVYIGRFISDLSTHLLPSLIY